MTVTTEKAQRVLDRSKLATRFAFLRNLTKKLLDTGILSKNQSAWRTSPDFTSTIGASFYRNAALRGSRQSSGEKVFGGIGQAIEDSSAVILTA